MTTPIDLGSLQMPESDPKFLRTGQWTRRNGQLAEGTIIDREGTCLIINALDIRACPFKVAEDKVTLVK